MKQLLEWIKTNVKEGANVAEAENLIEAENPVHSIKTKDEALQFIERTPFFREALDSATSRRVENALTRFKEEKLPGMKKTWEEDLRKELNPEETPEQKKIRELEEWKAEQLKSAEGEALKAELRKQAKDLGMDPLKAERYHVYGEKASDFLKQDREEFKTEIDSRLDSEIKNRFGGEPPKKGPDKDPTKMMDRASFDGLSAKDKMDFSVNGGEIIDS